MHTIVAMCMHTSADVKNEMYINAGIDAESDVSIWVSSANMDMDINANIDMDSDAIVDFKCLYGYLHHCRYGNRFR